MTISKGLWIGLAVSIGIGILIFLFAVGITWHKVRKVRKEVRNSEKDINNKYNMALERQNSGELLWELKNKYKNPLEDVQLEFLINTFLRNKYKEIALVGFEADYEKKSFIKLAKAKIISNNKSDLYILNTNDKINDDFDKAYKIIENNKMIAVTNATRKNKNIKRLITYMKTTKMKYDYLPIGKGIILVVK